MRIIWISQSAAFIFMNYAPQIPDRVIEVNRWQQMLVELSVYHITIRGVWQIIIWLNSSNRAPIAIEWNKKWIYGVFKYSCKYPPLRVHIFQVHVKTLRGIKVLLTVTQTFFVPITLFLCNCCSFQGHTTHDCSISSLAYTLVSSMNNEILYNLLFDHTQYNNNQPTIINQNDPLAFNGCQTLCTREYSLNPQPSLQHKATPHVIGMLAVNLNYEWGPMVH